MSVAAATGAVSTHQHQQPTAEQIRLAQLIDDKKHDQPEVQDIVRKVLEVVANSTQEEALVALFDCDYDYERTVALLIEKGHDIASEWRTATNHKLNKKQQQKNAAMKNGFGGENDENAQQQQQRGNDGFSQRGKSRAGRSRFQQQHNGGDIQNNTTNTNQQQNDNNYNPQQRQRGGSGYRGRNRGGYRGGSRGNDRNHQQYEQQPQDSNLDTSSPSDTTQRFTDVPYTNRRGGGAGRQQQQQQQQQRWDVGNWNGETLIYSRSSKDEEQQASNSDNNTSNTINGPAGGTSNVNNGSELNTQQKSKSEFDPVEAARHIKNVIGIGQSQQQQQQQQQSNASAPKPLMDIKPLMGNQQLGQQQKSNIVQSKSMGQNLNTKITTPPPPPRIPHQPVIFSDRFDGGMHKIDIQFGNLGEPLDDTSSQNVSVPIASSSSSSFYQHSEPTTSVTKQNTMLSSVHNSQRSTIPHHSTEQSSFVSPSAHAHSTRPSEQQQHQQPVMNQQRVLPPHMQQQQQPSMAMKNVVPPQYAVHPQQHQMNAQNLLIQSLLYHAHPQQESVPLDTSYDPAAFQLPSLDFNTTYFVAPTLNQQPQQPQTQQRYLVSQPPLPPQQPQSQQQQHQQTASNRQASSNNVQTTASSSVPSSSTSTTSSTAPKKGPAVPPGMFISTAPPTQPAYSNAYSTTYGVPPSVGGQQQTSATTYSTPYDPEHVFTTAFMQLANPQAQSPSGTYGSVTPPVQQPNQQQALNNNDNKTMNYRAPFNENLVLLQQYQQYAIQQSNSQQQGQQATGHSSAPLSYFLGHPASGPSYSPGPPIMFAQPTTAMTQQQQTAKQQGQQYNQNNPSAGIGGNDDYYGRASSSSANKEAQYMYTVSTQPQQGPPQSVGQQHGVNKQQQRASGNVYNNQQRPFQ